MSIARHVSKVMDRIAPLALAEKWDNVRPFIIRLCTFVNKVIQVGLLLGIHVYHLLRHLIMRR